MSSSTPLCIQRYHLNTALCSIGLASGYQFWQTLSLVHLDVTAANRLIEKTAKHEECQLNNGVLPHATVITETDLCREIFIP